MLFKMILREECNVGARLLGWCTSCSGKRQSRAETSAPPGRTPIKNLPQMSQMRTDLEGMASLPYPRSNQTIFPQKPQNTTQPNHLWASVKSVGGSSTLEISVSICEICGRIFSARSFREFCEFCGRIGRGWRGYGRDAIPSY